jgi:hypothetical protein
VKAVTNFLYNYNMSGTIARHGGQVQLDESYMPLALNMGKLATAGFLHITEWEIQYCMKKPCSEVQEAKRGGVEYQRQTMLKAATNTLLATLIHNHTDGYLPCQMVLLRMRRYCGDAKEQVHLHPPDTQR